MARLALTSWSLNRLLTADHEPLQLEDVPARMRDAGIGTLEICHFHFPDTGAATLQRLRARLDVAGVELFSILIDTGDISSGDADARERDIQVNSSWIDVAATLGAKAVRVVAGEGAPDDEPAIQRSIDALRHLSAYAGERKVRVLTENFRSLASSAHNCLRILDALDGSVGLCADIGNCPAECRIDEFHALAARAESVHVKATYNDAGMPDLHELRQCLDATGTAGFNGPYTLVYDRPGDPWRSIAQLRAIVEPYTSFKNSVPAS